MILEWTLHFETLQSTETDEGSIEIMSGEFSSMPDDAWALQLALLFFIL